MKIEFYLSRKINKIILLGNYHEMPSLCKNVNYNSKGIICSKNRNIYAIIEPEKKLYL